MASQRVRLQITVEARAPGGAGDFDAHHRWRRGAEDYAIFQAFKVKNTSLLLECAERAPTCAEPKSHCLPSVTLGDGDGALKVAPLCQPSCGNGKAMDKESSRIRRVEKNQRTSS